MKHLLRTLIQVFAIIGLSVCIVSTGYYIKAIHLNYVKEVISTELTDIKADVYELQVETGLRNKVQLFSNCEIPFIITFEDCEALQRSVSE